MSEAKFHVGQIVKHELFDYRGVVVDVDGTFALSDEWYDEVARSRPPKDEPWYHVLPHGTDHATYVAQRNLAPDPEPEPVVHPMLEQFFSAFQDGRYVSAQPLN